MTDIAADERIRRDVPGAGRGGRGRRVGPDPEPGDARRATSATPRRRRTPCRPCSSTGRASWSRPARAAPGASRSTTSSSARGSRRWRGASWSPRSSCRAPTDRRGRRPRPADAAPRPRPGVGHAGLRGPRRRARPGSPTAASGRGRSSSPTRPACWPTRRRPDLAKMERLEAPVRRGQPVAAIDAGEPRVPPGDAPRPGPPGGRHRDRAPGRSGRGSTMTTTQADRADRQRPRALDRGRAAPHAARGPARRPRADRHQGVLPRRRVRRVHGPRRRPERRFVPDARGRGRRRGRDDRRGARRPATASIRSSRRSSRPAPPSAGSASRAS